MRSLASDRFAEVINSKGRGGIVKAAEDIEAKGVPCDHTMVSRWASGDRKPSTGARFVIQALWEINPLDWELTSEKTEQERVA
jgi:hypothetical protein